MESESDFDFKWKRNKNTYLKNKMILKFRKCLQFSQNQ